MNPGADLRSASNCRLALEVARRLRMPALEFRREEKS